MGGAAERGLLDRLAVESAPAAPAAAELDGQVGARVAAPDELAGDVERDARNADACLPRRVQHPASYGDGGLGFLAVAASARLLDLDADQRQHLDGMR